ncbi:calpain-11-like isoform X1 [Hemiscyllium ocellatum]|uniref:calpain-11-like isoform X1 n=2 Tax=Hemiscyllium ocellatum TaxID=170820 RepID=UPI00296766E3|nr:calpain-11-like isoform X1 [Hemiscyllium ocellatum]XP_060711686.1 calpain-11-like isoform X1 [Hemiscyllium ocellatum]
MDEQELLSPRTEGRAMDRSSRLSVRGTGRQSKPSSFNGQDYESLQKACLQSRCLFEDLSFPADRTSIGDSKVKAVQWRRPHQIHRNPQFIVKGVSRFDLCQGSVLGDCWFLAALSSLTMEQDLFAHVVPPNQDFQRNYCGIFHFRFWHFGEWVDVVVDDLLPTDEKGQLIFVRSCDWNEFWCALMEKAYAKLYGSYGDLHMGQISEALVDFTGGVKSVISLRKPPSDLWMTLRRAICFGSFMGCSTPAVQGGEQVLSNGLVMTHAYSITGVEEVPYKNRMELLIRVRNPWGNEMEWKGRWSDRSEQWNRIDPDIKEQLLLKRADGEFWMAMQDFKAQFAQLVICNLTPDFLRGANQQKWALSIHQGAWLSGQTAGGNIDNKGSFCTNPQYCVTLSQNDMDRETNTSTFIVCLLQKPRDRQRNKSPRLFIACPLFKFQEQDGKLPQTFLNERYLVKQIKYRNVRETSETYQLEPGTYVLEPSTYYPNEQAEFLLRAYFQKGSYHRDTSSNSNLQHPMATLDRSDYSSWEQIFNKYAQIHPSNWSLPRFNGSESLSPPLTPSPMSPNGLLGRPFWAQVHPDDGWSERYPPPMSPSSPTSPGREITAAGLQKILNGVFLQGHRTSEGFSLDSCRAMVLLMDFSGTGGLDKHDFRRLWEKLMLFKELFQKSDLDGMGRLNPAQLSERLQEVGFTVTNSALSLMTLRYGDSSGRISLDSFVNCFLRVEFTTKMYSRLNKGGSELCLTEAEWMLLTMYL